MRRTRFGGGGKDGVETSRLLLNLAIVPHEKAEKAFNSVFLFVEPVELRAEEEHQGCKWPQKRVVVSKSRVLIVEDEVDLGELLEQAFRESGYIATLARNGREGLRLAPEYDIVIADVMMPTLNGFEMVRALRGAACTVPVIFLTAKDAIPDRVEGLRLGGDDYLLKPFALEELLARVEALLRRARAARDVLEYADLRIDRRERLAYRGGDFIALSNTEFSLLEAFLLSPGVPLSKATLLHDVWHDDAVRDENIVEVYMGYLRSKTETKGRARLLHTVRGRGYVLESHET